MSEIKISEAKEAYLYLKDQKYTALRKLQRIEEGYYLQTFNPFPDENKERPYITHKVKPPRGRRIVDGPADWLAMDKVVCHIQPLTTSSGEEIQKNQSLADHNEKWGQALLGYLAMIQPYYLRMAAQQLPLRGESWLKVDADWKYILDPEAYNGIPFRWIVPDSMMVYSVLETDSFSRPMMVFEEKVHTFGYLQKLVDSWNTDKKKVKLPFKDVKEWQDVILVEWWTPESRGYFAGLGGITESSWYAVPIDGEQITANPNKLVPYIRGFSSLGIWPYDGDLTKLIVGFLRPMGDVIVQDSRDRSKIDTITNYWAAPITKWRTDGSIVLADGDKIIAPGHIYEEIKDRKEFIIESAPPIPTSLVQQISMNEGLLEEYDPMVLRGRGTPGETAVGQSQRVGLGLQKWEPLKITLRQMLSNALGTTFRIVEEMGVPVKIYELSLKKDDINGYYKVEIDIKPGNPEEQVRRMLLAKDLAEFYSDEDIAEKFLGEEDATGFVRKTRISKMIKLMSETPNSALWNLVYGQAIKELNLEDVQAQLEATPPELAISNPASGQTVQQGPVQGAHPAAGVPGVATAPPIGQPQSQEELEAAQQALLNIGGG